MQIIQQPDKVTILYSETYEVRHVRMNQPHPAQVIPSWNGDSVGHYEGDTLVIDTVGLKSGRSQRSICTAWLICSAHRTPQHCMWSSAIGYSTTKPRKRSRKTIRRTILPPMVDNGIARDPDYKGKGLQLELTVEDEGVFTMPWSARMIYWPPLVPMGQWPEITCVENANGYDGRNLAKKAPTPRADKPDF
jgi:hypothetical protein